MARSGGFTIRGRMSASEFKSVFFLCFGLWVTELLLLGLPGAIASAINVSYLQIYVAFQIAMFVLIKAVIGVFLVKRLHDLNESGWQALLYAVPGGDLYYIVRGLSEEGTPGDNRFGPDPKAGPPPQEDVKSGLAAVGVCAALFVAAFAISYVTGIGITKDARYYDNLADDAPKKFRKAADPLAFTAVSAAAARPDRVQAVKTLSGMGASGAAYVQSVERVLSKKTDPTPDDAAVLQAIKLLQSRANQ